MIFVSNPGSLLLVFIVVLGALLPVSCLPAIGETQRMSDPILTLMVEASTERALVRSRHGHGGQPEVLSTNEGTEQSKSATSQLTEMQAYATEASEPKMNAEDRKQVLKQSHAAQTTTEIQQQGIDTSQHKDKEDPEDLEQVLKRVQEIQNSKQAKAKSEMENHADEPSSIWKQITEFILLAMQKSDDNDDNDNDRHHTRTTSSAMIFAVVAAVCFVVIVVVGVVVYSWWRQPSTKSFGRRMWLPQKQHSRQRLPTSVTTGGHSSPHSSPKITSRANPPAIPPVL
jgi:hypothetical protein